MLSVFYAFGQSGYERAVRLFEQADSIRKAEDNQLEKDNSNYQLAIQKFEEARDLFNAIDSTYFGFRCEVGMLKCQIFTKELKFSVIQQLKEELLLEDIQDTLLGFTYYHIGASLVEKNRFEEAINSFKNADQIFRFHEEMKRSIETNWFIAYVYGLLFDFDLENKYYENALMMLSNLPRDRFVVRSEFYIKRNRFEYYTFTNGVEKFWQVFFQCKELLNKYVHFFNDEDIGKFYLEASRYLRKLGLYGKSYEFLLEAKKCRLLRFQTSLSEALLLKGQNRYLESLDIYMNLPKEEMTPRQKAINHNNIGSIYLEVEEFEKANFHFQKALAINRNIYHRKGMAINLGNLAEVAVSTDQPKRAKTLLDITLEVFPKYKPEMDYIKSKYYKSIDHLDSAIYYAKKSVLDQKGNFFIDPTSTRPVEKVIVRFKWLLGLFDDYNSSIYRGKVLEVLEHYSKLHRFLKDYSVADEDLIFKNRGNFIYENAILAIIQGLDENHRFQRAFQFSEWSKVHSLQRAKKTSQAKFLAGLPESVIDKERNLKIDENYFRSQLSQQRSLDSPDSSRISRYQNRLADITNSQDSLENIIRTNYPRYHQLRYQDITLSVEEVQERLNPSQAFVEYYEGDTTSFVFTITKDNYQVKRIHLDDDTLITNYREYFEPDKFNPAQQEVNEWSFQIYQNYVEPAIGALGSDITELIVVPDGKLSYVPFDILLTQSVASEAPETIPYLLRHYQVHYTYSASLYFNDFSTLSTKDEYLAFAPEYETTLSDTASINRLGTFRNQVTPLKHNQEEVSYISSQFKGLGYFGTDANEKNFKEKVDEYGVLHLAMHTIVDDDDPMNSKLVFSNSKDSLEDDMLHAFEIYNMEIPSKLAVLSACETGFGQLAKGEGALSLARAFSYAGSPSVVMSHWPVDDQTTAILMKSFYNYLSKGLTKSEALRKAKLDFLDQTHSARMHPFFWGSFVVMGDDSPIYIKRLPKINPFLVLVGCLLMLGVAGFVVHRNEL